MQRKYLFATFLTGLMLYVSTASAGGSAETEGLARFAIETSFSLLALVLSTAI